MEMKITTPSFLANAALAVLHLESLISTFVLNFSVAKYHFLNQYHSVWRFGNLEPRNLNYIYMCVPIRCNRLWLGGAENHYAKSFGERSSDSARSQIICFHIGEHKLH